VASRRIRHLSLEINHKKSSEKTYKHNKVQLLLQSARKLQKINWDMDEFRELDANKKSQLSTQILTCTWE